jgi:acyl-CoA reductase-like NAD-dependent aldehyde dehydrogenase
MSTIDTVAMSVAGGRRQARSGEWIDAIDPSTGRVIARFPRGDAQDVDDAVQAAKSAFPAWRAMPNLDRAGLLRRLADTIVEHAEELAMLDVAENGSAIREMRGDAFAAGSSLRYFAGLALELRGETIPSDFDRVD